MPKSIGTRKHPCRKQGTIACNNNMCKPLPSYFMGLNMLLLMAHDIVLVLLVCLVALRREGTCLHNQGQRHHVKSGGAWYS